MILTIRTLPILFLTLLVLNCKDSENSGELPNNEAKKTENIEPSLKVRFKYKTNKADIFKIMMNNIKVDELQNKNIHIVEEVMPNTSEDVITANFDPGNLSNSILIHLGNTQTKTVEIIAISVSYGKKDFYISTLEDLEKHFVFNKCIERKEGEKTITTKRADGALHPVIYLKKSFIDELRKQ